MTSKSASTSERLERRTSAAQEADFHDFLLLILSACAVGAIFLNGAL